jgi:hypothetical protein
MASSSPNPSTADLVDGTVPMAAGLGIVTMALFPLAIPVLALTAVALIPLLIPLLLIPLAGALIAAPFLLLRRLFRLAAVLVKGETRWETPSQPSSSHSTG